MIFSKLIIVWISIEPKYSAPESLNTGIHSFKASHKLSGNTVFISANSTFPFVTGVTVENSVDLIPFLK